MKHNALAPWRSIRHSIATRLLAIVFSLYVLFAILLTITQMVMEYNKAHSDIENHLKVVHETISSGVATALWDMDDNHL
ncbi:MAG: hypothetical protein MI864_14545, partial [Pseudomonadales bacterium]|nr:hypothetical protein [Pseudomonadales bacterium]